MCIFGSKPPKVEPIAPPPLVKAEPDKPDPVADPEPLQEEGKEAELKIGTSRKADTAQRAQSLDSLRIPLDTGGDIASTGGISS